MIPLTRERTETAIIAAFRGAKPIENLADLMKEVRTKAQNNDDSSLKITSKWSETKHQLRRETHEKCAYCESNFGVVAFGDVEHYRPKSIYWWLAYVYDNYLVSCAICNRKFKGNEFEFTGPKMAGPEISAAATDAEIADLAARFAPDPLDDAAIADFEDRHRQEAPLLVNPYISDPEAFFAWNASVGTQEVELVPVPGSARAADVVDACERIYGLNRLQLRRRRFKALKLYEFMVDVLEDPGSDPGLKVTAQAFIDEALAPQSEYAGMLRFFEKRRQAG